MPAEVVHTAAPRIESTFKAREVEGVSRSLFLPANRVSAGRVFRAAEDDSGGRQFAGRSLRRHCRTSLFLP